MKQIIAIIISAGLLAGVVVAVFTYVQVNQEKKSMVLELEAQTKLLANNIQPSLAQEFTGTSTPEIQKHIDVFTTNQHVLGTAIFDIHGKNIVASSNFPNDVLNAPAATGTSDQNEDGEVFIKSGKNNLYVFTTPLLQGTSTEGTLEIIQNADYIQLHEIQTWKNNLWRFLIQIAIFLAALLLLGWWIIYKPISNLADKVKNIRTGITKQPTEDGSGSHFFLKPLAGEIAKITKSLFQARQVASEEARLRLEKEDTPWTAERLKEFIKAYLKEKKIFVVSNREPYIHSRVKNEIQYTVPASGMVTAIEPVMEACGGLWLAHGSGSADKETVDSHDKIQVPPDEPKYTLKRVWLTDKEVKGHYYGFSNEALWPLCHMAHTRPTFRQEDWTEYRRVNGKFAQSLLEEIKNIERPLVLVQDYQFALLPRMIKNSRPDAQVGIFWHIPWPSPESFSVCPWRKEILDGMLGADVIGFHTRSYCNNFMETVGKEVEALIDSEQFAITRHDHLSYIKPFPISIAFSGEREPVGMPVQEKNILAKLGIHTKYVGLGIDRLDYTKGILERFKGIEFFFNTFPAYKNQFTFLQISPPSREEIEKYKEYGEDVTHEAERINEKFGTDSWQPIILLKEHHTHEQLAPLYKRADVCMVTSLHDGMNLVSKEFVAAREDESGVLVLSQFTGASRDLKDALIVNPYSAEQTAQAIHTALTMSSSEQHRRMKRMRESVKNNNVYRWSAEFIKAVASLG